MKKTIFTLFILVLGIGLSACSTNWKEGSSGLTEGQLQEELDSLNSVTSSGAGSGRSLFQELRGYDDTIIYFAKSGRSSDGGVGPAYSLVSFGDYTHFGASEDVAALDLESSKVALLDGFDSQKKRWFVLAVQIQVAGQQPTTRFFASDRFEAEDSPMGPTKFMIHFDENQQQAFVLETFDVSPGTDSLLPLIHLKYITNSEGGEVMEGQFSILEGFET